MLEAYIYAGLRTPFGRHSGALSRVRPDDLLAGVVKEAVARSGFAPEMIDDVSIGCASQAGEDSRNVARHALLLAGLPVETPGAVHNRLCGSGLNALVGAAHAITCGEADVCVAGGVESMTRAPFVVGKAEQAFAKDFRVFDSSLGARFPNPKIETTFGADTMPQTADNLAREYQLTREECDQFALASQQKYAKAASDGFFKSEIHPVSVPQSKGKPDLVVSADEHPRPETTIDNLRKLKPLYPEGVTTAGNASGINDGAAAMVIASRDAGEKAGVKPLARILATGVAGVPPRVMGFGPVPAAKKALERAGLELKDMDVIEINEAFAAQVLACLKGFGLPLDDRRVNPNGGAIAVGHPLGASGARLALTAVRELQRSGGRYALVSMCIGVGQGIAVVLERAA
jgi:acetyl-CoA C-acetyltransferase